MKLLTRNAYAKLCGVSRQAIADRIKRGTLKTVECELPDGSMRQYINLTQSPMKRRKVFYISGENTKALKEIVKYLNRSEDWIVNMALSEYISYLQSTFSRH